MRVNNHFSLEVYGITHGHTATQLVELIPEAAGLGLPATTKREDQDTARAITETLSPTDLLLREKYGYAQPMDPPLRFVPLPDPSQSIAENARRIAYHKEIADIKAQLDGERDRFDAIDYAVTHAMLNGVPAMYADCSATERAHHKAADTTFSAEVEGQRELTALHTMITVALDSLPPEDAPVPNPEDRHRLVLFFGAGHMSSFEEKIAAANLPITVAIPRPTTQNREQTVINQETMRQITTTLMTLGHILVKRIGAAIADAIAADPPSRVNKS